MRQDLWPGLAFVPSRLISLQAPNTSKFINHHLERYASFVKFAELKFLSNRCAGRAKRISLWLCSRPQSIVNPWAMPSPKNGRTGHPMSPSRPNETITGVVLAGGRGSRMGHVDKGLQVLRGKPMVAWVLERFSWQVSELFINANQNQQQYASYGYPVLADELSDFAGPLAGLQVALKHASHSFVATVPCDSPFLPNDLVARLHIVLIQHMADIAIAKTGTQAHPVFSLCRRGVRDHLNAYLASGGRKIDQWYATLQVVEVSFDDELAAFSNINTRQELHEHDRGGIP